MSHTKIMLRIIFCSILQARDLFALESFEGMSDSSILTNTSILLGSTSDVLTNSTLHISSVIIQDITDSTVSCPTVPIFYRYIITLTQPQLIISAIIAGLGILIFLFVLINLALFSYIHQQKQNELLTYLTDIATELEGITAKASLHGTSVPKSSKRRRPVSFAALPPISQSQLTTTTQLKNPVAYKRQSSEQLKRGRSQSMATILEV